MLPVLDGERRERIYFSVLLLSMSLCILALQLNRRMCSSIFYKMDRTKDPVFLSVPANYRFPRCLVEYGL